MSANKQLAAVLVYPFLKRQLIKTRISIFPLLLLLSFGAHAQVSPVADTISTVHDTLPGAVPQKDILDILKKAFGAKPPPKNYKPADKKLYLSLFPAAGYSLQTRLVAFIAGNAAFYSGHKDSTEKLSNIVAGIAATQNNQLIFTLTSNIWTKDNKYNLLGDSRISKYPQGTFGLGGNTSLDSADLVDYSYLRIYQTVLRKVADNFYAGVGYDLDYHWGIKETGYKNGQVSDFEKYNPAEKTVSSGVLLDLLYDSRKNAINPSGGAYVNVILRNNYTFLGSDENWQSLLIDARKFFPFPAKSGNVLAFWTYDWLVLNGNPPYLDLPSTSWDTYTNTGRGYIQGRFRSRQMLYLESEYRFGLTANGLLGGVVFANVQSFSEWPGNYTFKYLQPAEGFGLRLKLNKASKTNIDIDYGFGTNNSHGLFINLGEVF